MRRITLATFAVLFAATVLVADNEDKKGKSDDDLIQGAWKVVEVQKGGKSTTTEFPFDTCEFKTNTLTLERIKQKDAFQVMFKLDASKKPKTMDLVRGKSVERAIYALDGEVLKISIASPDNPYPTSLESKEGDKWFSYVLKRVKKVEN
jgi:uncharacterized protein (TIGR03067 family)